MTVLHNLPNITDIADLVAILNSMGATAELSSGNSTLTVDASASRFNEPPPHLVSRMRGSLQLLGPLLARQGIVRLAMPGGCNIGARAVDLHEKGLRGLGATWTIDAGCFFAEAPFDGLVGGAVYLDKPSVGATMNTTGTLRVVATKVGAASALQQIVKLVEDAQGSKAPIARMADQVSGVFVPIVVGVVALA